MYTMWALSTVYNAYSPTPWMKKNSNCIRRLLMFSYSNTDILMLVYSNTECNQREGQKYQENASKSKAIILS